MTADRFEAIADAYAMAERRRRAMTLLYAGAQLGDGNVMLRAELVSMAAAVVVRGDELDDCPEGQEEVCAETG